MHRATQCQTQNKIARNGKKTPKKKENKGKKNLQNAFSVCFLWCVGMLPMMLHVKNVFVLNSKNQVKIA